MLLMQAPRKNSYQAEGILADRLFEPFEASIHDVCKLVPRHARHLDLGNSLTRGEMALIKGVQALCHAARHTRDWLKAVGERFNRIGHKAHRSRVSNLVE